MDPLEITNAVVASPDMEVFGSAHYVVTRTRGPPSGSPPSGDPEDPYNEFSPNQVPSAPNDQLNKHRMELPVVKLPKNWMSASPSRLKQIFEEWVTQTSLNIHTWHTVWAQQWWEGEVRLARALHAKWLSMPHLDQMQLEQRFTYGAELPKPPPSNVVEGYLRVDILKRIPEEISSKCMRYGYFHTWDILYRFMRDIIPHSSFSTLALADEIQQSPPRPPTTMIEELIELA
eukprot:6487814-Amphidinium_carterae.1